MFTNLPIRIWQRMMQRNSTAEDTNSAETHFAKSSSHVALATTGSTIQKEWRHRMMLVDNEYFFPLFTLQRRNLSRLKTDGVQSETNCGQDFIRPLSHICDMQCIRQIVVIIYRRLNTSLQNLCVQLGWHLVTVTAVTYNSHHFHIKPFSMEASAFMFLSLFIQVFFALP